MTVATARFKDNGALRQLPSLREATPVWTRIGLLSFGGPAGQIAVMHRTLVEERRWISEDRFLHALNFCMLLPGPEAQQLATYVGWSMHGYRGGLVAGLLFILPGAVAMMFLSAIYAAFGNVGIVTALFFGLKAAVLAIVLEAVFRIGRRSLRGLLQRLIAGAAFVSIFFFAVPFPVVVAAAALLGFIASRIGSLQGLPTVPGHASTQREPIPASASDATVSIATATIWLALWLTPVALIAGFLGTDDVFTRIAVAFSQMAVVTFGGAYAVLAYVAQLAVDTFQWLRPGEMLDGLGLAETTPGPLILVLQFVAFLAAYHHAGGLPPMLAGVFGSLIAIWVTFTPCFLWIFALAPYVERLRGMPSLSASLAAVTAAVVGVVLNLVVWFAIHTLFSEVRPIRGGGFDFNAPVIASVDLWAVGLAIAALVAVFGFKVGMATTLAGASCAGVALFILGVVR